MKIGIISDTHNNAVSILKAFELFKKNEVSNIIHCGDWTDSTIVAYIYDLIIKYQFNLRGVLGNRDDFISKLDVIIEKSFQIYPELLEFEEKNLSFGVYHGHNKKKLNEMIQSQIYQVILTGHTHKPKIETYGNTLVINPGSTSFSIPRSKNFKGSIAILDLDNFNHEILYLEPFLST